MMTRVDAFVWTREVGEATGAFESHCASVTRDAFAVANFLPRCVPRIRGEPRRIRKRRKRTDEERERERTGSKGVSTGGKRKRKRKSGG